MKTTLLALLFIFVLPNFLVAQNYSYKSPTEVKKYLEQIEREHPNYVDLLSLVKTVNGNDVWCVALGSGDITLHPAVAIVAGADPRHLLGTESALQLINQILQSENVDNLLKENTFYIFPNINPDATIGYFGKLKYHEMRTKSLYDNDRDGLMSEDANEDLNSDNIISTMIVESSDGKYIKHPDDNRILVLADTEKGEKGKYKRYTEGIDNDKDGLFNEDGADGVNLNRNFTYKFKNWGPDSGNYPVSELENRALLDFMYDAFNIHTLVVYGVNDNLYSPMKYVPKFRKGVDVKNSEQDAYIVDNNLAKSISELFKSKGINNFIAEKTLDGNILEWGYYHFGRNSFGTTVFSVDEKDNRGSIDAAFLKWADKNQVDCVTEWSKFNHPNFNGKIVELGSINPYAIYAPPLNLISEQISAVNQGVIEITEMAPRISLEDVNVEKLDGNIYRVTANIANRGKISTATAIGVQSYFVKYIRAQLILKNQKIVSGVRLTTIKKLDAGQVESVSWLVEGKGKIEIEVGAPQCGYVKKSLTL